MTVNENINDKLTALLAWAIQTQEKAPNQYYRDYYGGYIQAIKDALSVFAFFIESSGL